jgi:hypothetical protein
MTPEARAILKLAEQADQAIMPCKWCGVRGHDVEQCEDLTSYLRRQAEQHCIELKRIRYGFFWAGVCVGAFLAWAVGSVWK